ncbi:MAG: hypothetical protein QOD75_720 [Blastocatellia bacterium]|jgi:hypothetical protein|nr:hypothetical protein [Blastocatellia bacterium]
MNRLQFTVKILAIAIFMCALVSTAQAQTTRTFVSGVGDDANPCSRTAPCKTYNGAISHTARDGEISTLDPNGFGTVIITKSITINGGGGGSGYGSILAAGTNGVTVNITDSTDTRKSVRLDWLNINGASTGLKGVKFIAGNALHVENTVVDGFTQEGIDVNTPSNSPLLFLKNVTIRNCVGSGISTLAAGTNSTSIAFNGVNVTKCSNGLNAQNGTRGSIRDSMFGLNTTGINTSQVGSPTEVNIDSSLITGHATGINTGPGTHVRISRMLISQNANALGLGGLVDSGGNNTIHGNSNNQAPNGLTSQEN